MIGALLIALAGYEGIAALTHGVLISHASGVWRWLVVISFALFVGHVADEWARDDAFLAQRREGGST